MLVDMVNVTKALLSLLYGPNDSMSFVQTVVKTSGTLDFIRRGTECRGRDLILQIDLNVGDAAIEYCHFVQLAVGHIP